MLKKMFFLITILLLGYSASGCKGNSGAISNEKSKIRILFYTDQSFNMLYGDIFQSKYPNIDIEVIPSISMFTSGKDPVAELNTILDEQKPDVLLLTSDQYENLAEKDKLLDLEGLIKQDSFDIENMLPPITELLKTHGNGKLYGLSPSFGNRALFYNKDLFDKYGVSYPTDKMTWDDVFKLAKRFPTDGSENERVFGYSHFNMMINSNLDILMTMGATAGLSLVNPDTMTVTIHTDTWKNEFSKLIDAYKSAAISIPSDKNNESAKPDDFFKTQYKFVAGQAAMTLDGYNLIPTMIQAKSMIKDSKTFQWDLVSEPVDSTNPDRGTSYQLTQIFSINARSNNIAAAWQFVKYFNSEEAAKIKSKSPVELLTRTAYMKERDGHSLEGFYKLKASNQYSSNFSKIPPSFFQSFGRIIEDKIQAILTNKLSLDEALEEIQKSGQQELEKTKIQLAE